MASTNPLFLNTVLLRGSVEEKIEAARKAGFDQIEMWREDVSGSAKSADALKNVLQNSGVALTDYQVLLDFDGASVSRSSKRDEAVQMMHVARELGADTILVPANTSAQCDSNLVVDDLAWLADEARKYRLKIAYEAMAWSTFINTLPKAWDIIQKVNRDNLGLVVDAFHIFSLGRTVADLQDIPVERIFLVQLSDFTGLPDLKNIVETARHSRLLPGEGDFPLTDLVDTLLSRRYAGPVGLEVFNDHLKSQQADKVADNAMRALKALLTK